MRVLHRVERRIEDLPVGEVVVAEGEDDDQVEAVE